MTQAEATLFVTYAGPGKQGEILSFSGSSTGTYVVIQIDSSDYLNLVDVSVFGTPDCKIGREVKILSSHDDIPNGWHLADVRETKEHLEAILDQMGTWDIVGLVDGDVSGRGYGGVVRSGVLRPTGKKAIIEDCDAVPAPLYITCDNELSVWIDGSPGRYKTIDTSNIPGRHGGPLRQYSVSTKANLLAVQCYNAPGHPGNYRSVLASMDATKMITSSNPKMRWLCTSRNHTNWNQISFSPDTSDWETPSSFFGAMSPITDAAPITDQWGIVYPPLKWVRSNAQRIWLNGASLEGDDAPRTMYCRYNF